MNISFDNAEHFEVGFSEGSQFNTTMQKDATFGASFSSAEHYDVTFNNTETFNVEFGAKSGVPYEGQYVVTPSEETIVLNTNTFTMQGNVTINPIPSNYGKITWDGTKLTVS